MGLNDNQLVLELADAVGSETPVAVATVIDTSRSAPRRAGAKMLVYPDGRISGTVGGGEMEARVVQEAIKAFETGVGKVLDYELVDPGKGDPGVCGGEVRIYLEVFMPTPTVYVIGCGHVGRAVVDLAHWLGFRVVAYDDRPEMLEGLTSADATVSGTITDALENTPVTSDTHVVVVTRNVELDTELMPPLLSTPARTIGLIGSSRRWNVTRDRLRDKGIPDDQLDRVMSPIGVELHAETPEEIAVSILAEIIRERRSDAIQ